MPAFAVSGPSRCGRAAPALRAPRPASVCSPPKRVRQRLPAAAGSASGAADDCGAGDSSSAGGTPPVSGPPLASPAPAAGPTGGAFGPPGGAWVKAYGPLILAAAILGTAILAAAIMHAGQEIAAPLRAIAGSPRWVEAEAVHWKDIAGQAASAYRWVRAAGAMYAVERALAVLSWLWDWLH